MAWFYFALAAPLFYAVLNIVDDNLIQFAFDNPLIGASLAGIVGAVPIFGILFISIAHISLHIAVYSFIAGLLLTVFYYFYYASLKRSFPSVVITSLNLVPASLIFLAYFILHERLTALETVGFLIVLIPSVILTLSTGEFKKFKLSNAVIPMLFMVITLDAVSLLLKYAYEHTSFYPVFFFSALGTGVGGLIFYLVNRFYSKQKILKRGTNSRYVLAIIVLSALVNFGAELFANLAISKGPVSVVRVIEGIQPIYVLLIAVIFYPLAPKYFREAKGSNLVRKFVLIAITIAGLILIVSS